MSKTEDLQKSMNFLKTEYEKLELNFIFLQDGYKKVFAENLSLRAKVNLLQSKLNELHMNNATPEEILSVINELEMVL